MTHSTDSPAARPTRRTASRSPRTLPDSVAIAADSVRRLVLHAREEEDRVGQRLAPGEQRVNGLIREEVFLGRRVYRHEAPVVLRFEQRAEVLVVETLAPLDQFVPGRRRRVTGLLGYLCRHPFVLPESPFRAGGRGRKWSPPALPALLN